MGALSFDALLRSLKRGAPDPVYYLHGDEDVLKDEAVRALLERAVDPAASDFNIDQRWAPDLDPEAFHALLNTPPILPATPAVVPRGARRRRDGPREPRGRGRAGGGAGRRHAAGLRRGRVRAAHRGRGAAHRAGARAARHERRADGRRAGDEPRGHGPRPRRTRPWHSAEPPRGRAPHAPACGAALRPGQLGADRGELGPLG